MKYTPNITIPSNPKVGDIIEIKTLIPHPMLPAVESKQKDETDTPAKFIEFFEATFNDELVFKARLTTDISANPYLSFFYKVTKSGNFIFTWKENGGQAIQSVQHKLTTSG